MTKFPVGTVGDLDEWRLMPETSRSLGEMNKRELFGRHLDLSPAALQSPVSRGCFCGTPGLTSWCLQGKSSGRHLIHWKSVLQTHWVSALDIRGSVPWAGWWTASLPEAHVSKGKLHCLFSVCCLETGVLCVTMAVLEPALWTRLTSHWEIHLPRLLSVWVRSMCHHHPAACSFLVWVEISM